MTVRPGRRCATQATALQSLGDPSHARRAAPGAGPHVSAERLAGRSRAAALRLSHFEPVTPEQLEQIERLVNAQIRGNVAVETTIMAMEEAIAGRHGAVWREVWRPGAGAAHGRFSPPNCAAAPTSPGRRHRPVQDRPESGVAAGVRRIEAVTGENSNSSRPRPPVQPVRIWRPRRSTSRASRPWPRVWTAPTPRACVSPSISSRTSSAAPSSYSPPSPTARSVWWRASPRI
jgi:hypothetical protein